MSPTTGSTSARAWRTPTVGAVRATCSSPWTESSWARTNRVRHTPAAAAPVSCCVLTKHLTCRRRFGGAADDEAVDYAVGGRVDGRTVPRAQLGRMHESIAAPLPTERRQDGCTRHCFVIVLQFIGCCVAWSFWAHRTRLVGAAWGVDPRKARWTSTRSTSS